MQGKPVACLTIAPRATPALYDCSRGTVQVKNQCPQATGTESQFAARRAMRGEF
jgi:hypothetical protein